MILGTEKISKPAPRKPINKQDLSVKPKEKTIDSDGISSKREKQPDETQASENNKYFQAIGLIYGIISNHEGQLSIIIEGNNFNLTGDRHIKYALCLQVERNPDVPLYLKVYPKWNVNNKEFRFQVVCYWNTKPATETNPVNVFLLAGVWQFLPQLRGIPVMTIYRNKLKENEDKALVKYIHIPVSGFHEKPYKFNPKAPTEGKPKFYEMLTKFNPNGDKFEFLMLLDQSEKLPRRVKKPKPQGATKPMNFQAKPKTK